MSSNITMWQGARITRTMREQRNGHRGAMVWFTGLSGSGKSTLAYSIEQQLHLANCCPVVLDGDHIRHGLCADLGFSAEARAENIRRVGEAGKLFVETGSIVLAAFISPFQHDRVRVRELIGAHDFIEVYCDCPVAICEARDVKGLYRRARSGAIAQFTGISSPYEVPAQPDITLDTSVLNVEHCAARVIGMLRDRGILGQEAGGQERALPGAR